MNQVLYFGRNWNGNLKKQNKNQLENGKRALTGLRGARNGTIRRIH